MCISDSLAREAAHEASTTHAIAKRVRWVGPGLCPARVELIGDILDIAHEIDYLTTLPIV